jgi:hypothetical protein
VSSRLLSEISAKTSVVACSIEEHVMYFSTSFWRYSQEIWQVQHRGGDFGIMDLAVKGSLPETFGDLRARYLARQAAAGGDNSSVDHVADIPLELARSITGFKHDEINPGIDDTGFRALRIQPHGALAQAMKPRWKFW